MDTRISVKLLNNFLYYTYRDRRFNCDIVDVATADKSDVMYSDIYDEYVDDTEFNYLFVASYVNGAAAAYYNAFTAYVQLATGKERCYIKEDSGYPLIVAYNIDGGEDLELFDYTKPDDKALLEDITINEIEKVHAGPDLEDDPNEDY